MELDVGQCRRCISSTRHGLSVAVISSRRGLWREAFALGKLAHLNLAGPFPRQIALRALRRFQCKVVLLDCVGGHESFSLAGRLARRLPGVGIVVVADAAGPRHPAQALAYGASALLVRPLSLAEFMLAVGAAECRGIYLASEAVRCGGEGKIPLAPLWSVDSRLTPRELDILRLEAAGLLYKEIAARLGLSVHTVNHHLYTIRRKLGARTAIEAIHKAFCRDCTNPNISNAP